MYILIDHIIRIEITIQKTTIEVNEIKISKEFKVASIFLF
jgi:hypothetical protein